MNLNDADNHFSVYEYMGETGIRNWMIMWNSDVYLCGSKAEIDKAVEHCLSPGVGKHAVKAAEQCPICERA